VQLPPVAEHSEGEGSVHGRSPAGHLDAHRRTAGPAGDQDVVGQGPAPRLVIDLLFGPVVFRLFNGQAALSPGDARKLAAIALGALRPMTDRSTRGDAGG
jgi:hypothetical protein